MKKSIVLTGILLIALTACTIANSPISPVETSVNHSALPTVVVQTALKQATETATALLPTSTSVPTATPAPTVTPDTDIWRNCQHQNPKINPSTYQILGFGTSACKLLKQSPDGTYMAYANLDSTSKEILLIETMGKAREINWRKIAQAGGCGKCTIRDIQWGKNNTLILHIEATTAGPSFISVVNLDGVEIANLRGDFGQWNVDQSAFYTVKENFWIFDAFGVYDYTTGKSFNLEKHNGVKVSNWSGNVIYLSVRPYVQNGDKFCNQPSYAARLELTPDGPKFSIIRKAPNLDLSVDRDGKISETQYKYECSELEG